MLNEEENGLKIKNQKKDLRYNSHTYPLVSIITIVYNAKNDLEKTINSVINQNYENIEYIIIDGASTDGTMDIVDQYKKHIDIIISEPDNGIYDAMNKGLMHISGDWVNFLNAGDIFYDADTLKKTFNNLPDNIKLIYGDWINVNNKGLNRYIQSNTTLNMKTLSSKFQMNHQSLFVKVEYLVKYDLHYKIKADYQWIIDIVRELDSNNIKYINEALILYDIEGLSAKQLWMNMSEYIYLTHKNFGKFQVFKNTPIYLKYLIKYMLLKLK